MTETRVRIGLLRLTDSAPVLTPPPPACSPAMGSSRR